MNHESIKVSFKDQSDDHANIKISQPVPEFFYAIDLIDLQQKDMTKKRIIRAFDAGSRYHIWGT